MFVINKKNNVKRKYGQYKRDVTRIIKQCAWYEKIGYKMFVRKLNSKTWQIHVSYTSPKGRNHYEKTMHVAIWDAIPNYIVRKNYINYFISNHLN